VAERRRAVAGLGAVAAGVRSGATIRNLGATGGPRRGRCSGEPRGI
jgi:hypothetical protein